MTSAPSPFTEKLSVFMVTVAALGAFLVLVDPTLTLTVHNQVLVIGKDGFSADLKGAVISAILIGGWTAVKEYWLGSSAGTVKSAETIQRIAESSPSTSAAAVAAATGAAPATPAVTPAPMTADGIIPAAEVAQPKAPTT